jgi:hypothetical protein
MAFLTTHNGMLSRRYSAIDHEWYMLTIYQVQYLPQTDFIVVLGEHGTVVEKGSYAQLLDRPGGYVQQLGIKPNQIEKDGIQNDNTVGATEPQKAVKISNDAPASAEGHRQMTDLAVYKYYFSAMGWWRLAVLLLFLVANGGIGGFRCMSRSSAHSLYGTTC